MAKMRLVIRILLVVTVVLMIGFRVPKRRSSQFTGFYIQLPEHTSQTQCGDFDIIMLQHAKDHSLAINSEAVTKQNVGGRLHGIYHTRAERLLLIRADPELRFQDVAEIIDVAHGAVKDLYVTLITPGT
jgi:biopolymer transport protein ExbD